MQDNDGWIEHTGGEMPVGSNVIVDVKLKHWTVLEEIPAGELYWYHCGDGCDISAYKVSVPKVKPAKIEMKDVMSIYCNNFLTLSNALENVGGSSAMILARHHDFLETLARNGVMINTEIVSGK